MKLILEKCDEYIELFKNETNIDSHKINEFIDFANLHLPSNSEMAFSIYSLNRKNFSNHAEKIKEFIKVNGSANTEKNINIFSSNSNAEIIARVFGICTIFFSVGFYFGIEKVNNDTRWV